MNKHGAQTHNVFRNLKETKNNKTVIQKMSNYCNWNTVKISTCQKNHVLNCQMSLSS